MVMDNDDLEYAGFWIRLSAALIDTVLQIIIILPLMIYLYGPLAVSSHKAEVMSWPAELMLSHVLPMALVVSFWIMKQATPGKLMLSLRIVDARTGDLPSLGQWLGRYLSLYLSCLFIFIGFIWVAFDRKKQAWHDKFAGTVVVRTKNRGTEPVRFESTSSYCSDQRNG